jgi:predicted XRE-type DNA-binding protein
MRSMKKALDQIRRARAQKVSSEDALRAAILAARDAGCKQDAIAEAAGVTRPRVSQILKEARR